MRRTGRLFRTLARTAIAGIAGAALVLPGAGFAQGDLLIAPTRLVLDGRGGAEVILSNQGNEPETYRISLELRRMDENGNLVTVDESSANATEKAALAMIR
jgi:P pilus assembly chaperone PapD